MWTALVVRPPKSKATTWSRRFAWLLKNGKPIRGGGEQDKCQGRFGRQPLAPSNKVHCAGQTRSCQSSATDGFTDSRPIYWVRRCLGLNPAGFRLTAAIRLPLRQ